MSIWGISPSKAAAAIEASEGESEGAVLRDVSSREEVVQKIASDLTDVLDLLRDKRSLPEISLISTKVDALKQSITELQQQVEKQSSYLSTNRVTEASVGLLRSLFVFVLNIPVIGPIFALALIINLLCLIHLYLPNTVQELVIVGLEWGLSLLALLFSPLLYSISHIPQTEAFSMVWQSIRTHAGSLVMEATSSQATALASSYIPFPSFSAFFASASTAAGSAAVAPSS